MADYIQQQVSAHSERTLVFEKFLSLFNNKLWHQLGVALMDTLSDTWFDQQGRRLSLYKNFVEKCSRDIEPLIVAQFAISSLNQCSDTPSKITLIESLLSVVKNEPEALLLLNLEVAHLHLVNGETARSATDLDSVRQNLDKHQELSSLVWSRYYQVKMQYHKIAGTASQYFRNALLYLSYTPLEKISTDSQVELASSLGLSALAAEDQYNFGELLQHPIMGALKSSNASWIYNLLSTFDQGRINDFESLFAAHSKGQPILANNAAFLRQKIRIMNLMEIVFVRPSKERNLSFSEIAKVCQIGIDEVELLLMKGMSLGVITGVVDQVDQCVRIKRVQPRVLNNGQIEGLRQKLSSWADQVHVAIKYLETTAPDLMTA